MRNLASLTFISLFIAMINLAWADGVTLALSGNDRGALACITCHGRYGEGTPANGFPKLAGLNAQYLRGQLKALANGDRTNVIMTPIAQNLNDTERSEAAHYYAGLKIPVTMAPPVGEMNSASAQLAIQSGEQLAAKGRPAEGLPACFQCHGTGGKGVGTSFPMLAGQSALYIENRLRTWQQEAHPAGPAGIMKGVVSKLSAKDIRDVAAYFSALPANGR